MKELLFEIYIALHYTYTKDEAKRIFNELLETINL